MFGVVLEITPGLVDRGADLSWVSQYPFEQEILFAPLTALEVCDRRIEDQVVVVSVRPTVNQSAQTIEAVIAKLQQSHIHFLDLIDEDFCTSGFPEAARAPLRMLKCSAKIRQPSWFNRTSNYKQVSEAALRAKKEVLGLLNSDKAWVGGAEGREDTDLKALASKPEHLFDAARLCAREGEVDIAIRALQLSLLAVQDEADHPKLQRDDIALVQEVLRAMVADGCFPRGLASRAPSWSQVPIGGDENLQPAIAASGCELSPEDRVRQRMLLMHMLLKADPDLPSNRAQSGVEARRASADDTNPWADDDANPWAATIVAIAVEDEPTMDGLVRLLVRAQLVRETPLVKGELVLACREEENWAEGTIEEVREVKTAEEDQALVDAKKSGKAAAVMVPASSGGEPIAPTLKTPASEKKKERKFKQYTHYSVRVSKDELLTTKDVVPFGSGGGGAMLRGAARNGHDSLVAKLLKAGVCIHEANPRAETALHLAARGGELCHATVCELLVRSGADGFQYSKSGFRAYDLAVTSVSEDVRLAIKPSKGDLELHECLQDTNLPSLLRAAATGEKALMNALRVCIEMDVPGTHKATADVPGPHEVTVLMLASARGWQACVHRLLEMGADRYLATSSGCTSLTIAARENHPVVVAELLATSESDREADGGEGAAAHSLSTSPTSHTASHTGAPELAREGGAALSAVVTAAHVVTAAPAVAHAVAHATARRRRPSGALPPQDVKWDNSYANAAEEKNVTALMRAAQGGFVEVSELLLKAKAEVDTVRSDTKRSALVAAARNGHTDVAVLLVEWGARGDLADVKGRNVFASAAAFGQVDVIKGIGEKLGNKLGNMPETVLEQTDEKKQTPLLIALRYGHDAATQSLLQLGAKVGIAPETSPELHPVHDSV